MQQLFCIFLMRYCFLWLSIVLLTGYFNLALADTGFDEVTTPVAMENELQQSRFLQSSQELEALDEEEAQRAAVEAQTLLEEPFGLEEAPQAPETSVDALEIEDEAESATETEKKVEATETLNKAEAPSSRRGTGKDYSRQQAAYEAKEKRMNGWRPIHRLMEATF